MLLFYGFLVALLICLIEESALFYFPLTVFAFCPIVLAEGAAVEPFGFGSCIGEDQGFGEYIIFSGKDNLICKSGKISISDYTTLNFT